MGRDDDITPPRGVMIHTQTQEQLQEMIVDIAFDLDLLTAAFGMLMKAHSLELEWKNLQRSMSERRRKIES
jgi:hypothetical protein